MVDDRKRQNQPPAFEFYSTLGCHLCEEAARLLHDVLPVDGITVVEVDIAYDEQLMAEYGQRIPVLRRRHDGLELQWPFTRDDVRWLKQASHNP